jgi:hypothetical protein
MCHEGSTATIGNRDGRARHHARAQGDPAGTEGGAEEEREEEDRQDGSSEAAGSRSVRVKRLHG